MAIITLNTKRWRWQTGIGFLILVIAVLMLMLRAGFWQLDRAQQKAVRQQALALAAQQPPKTLSAIPSDPARLAYHRVTVTGRYWSDKQFLLDNQVQTLDDRSKHIGFRVITPFELEDGAIVLIDRGWIAAMPQRQQLPDIAVTAAPITLSGAVYPVERGFRLGSMDADTYWPRVIQYLDYPAIAERLHTSLNPLLIVLDFGHSTAYAQQQRPPATLSPQRHTAYAVQWFAMSAALVVLFLFATITKR